MKVLIVNQILYTHTDGVIPEVKTIKDTMIYQMCLGFKEIGHDVTLAASSEFQPTELEEYAFPILWFDSNCTKLLPPAILPYSKALKKYLRKEQHQYDLIISKEVFTFASRWLSRICPEKTVLWVEQAFHQRKFHQIPSKIWFAVIARYWMNGVKTVIPCSESAGVFLKRYLTNTTEEVVEHGIDIQKFTPAPVKSRQLMVSSRLVKQKNIEGIIRVFSKLHSLPAYRDIILYIAGRGSEEEHLKEVARQTKCDEKVCFLGFLPQAELNRYMSESLAFLIRTDQDLNMVSVPESVCSGTPLVMNEVPLSKWYVKRYDLGIVKSEWDESDLINVIENNLYYTNNCKIYRKNLSVTSAASRLVALSGINPV